MAAKTSITKAELKQIEAMRAMKAAGIKFDIVAMTGEETVETVTVQEKAKPSKKPKTYTIGKEGKKVEKITKPMVTKLGNNVIISLPRANGSPEGKSVAFIKSVLANREVLEEIIADVEAEAISL